jgi:hypothetical protein
MEPRSGTHRKIKPRCIVNYSTSRRPAIDAYPETKIILFTLYTDYIPKSLIAVAGIDLALSKAEGIVGLAAHLNSLLVPRLPLPELAADSLGAQVQTYGQQQKNRPRRHSRQTPNLITKFAMSMV